MELGEFIKERRAQIGMTQIRLAELLGRSASTIRSWERGASAPPADLRDGLAAALNVDAAELSELLGEPERESDFDAAEPGAAAEAEEVAALDADASADNAVRSKSISEVFAEFEEVDARPEGNIPVGEAQFAAGMAANDAAVHADAEPDDAAEAPDAMAGEQLVDQTTVMAEGLAMLVPLAPERHQGDGDPADREVEDDVFAVGHDGEPGEDRDDDTDESEVVDIDPPDRSLQPRLLGTALSTDVIVEPEVTQVATPYAATQMMAGRPSSTVSASPYPDAYASADVIPEDRGYVADWTEQRTYQVRRILTVVGVLVLFLVLRWSMGGFMEGFQTLKDSILSNVNI